ncbi:MAG: folate family ECF transporter S component [Vulcanimicrobiota bacterium]
MKGSAQRIALGAMIVALCFVISLLPSFPGPITKFAGFPLLLGGMLVGPRTGFAVGCLTDLLGFAFRPTGPFFPGFTLTQGLTAMIPGLLTMNRDPFTWKKLGHEERPGSADKVACFFRLLAIFGLTQVLTSVLMVSFFRAKIVAGTPLMLELTTRAIAQATHVPVYAFMAYWILSALSETDLYERLLKARK